ncbi:MAG: hypothetical protein OXC92_06760 [Flavobacteriaceae bacterium]|nr:hypothetical protein [Flavobacteriaceae bacterium]
MMINLLTEKVKHVLDIIKLKSSLASENENTQSEYYNDFLEQELRHNDEKFEVYKLAERA